MTRSKYLVSDEKMLASIEGWLAQGEQLKRGEISCRAFNGYWIEGSLRYLAARVRALEAELNELRSGSTDRDKTGG